MVHKGLWHVPIAEDVLCKIGLSYHNFQAVRHRFRGMVLHVSYSKAEPNLVFRIFHVFEGIVASWSNISRSERRKNYVTFVAHIDKSFRQFLTPKIYTVFQEIKTSFARYMNASKKISTPSLPSISPTEHTQWNIYSRNHVHPTICIQTIPSFPFIDIQELHSRSLNIWRFCY